MAASPQKVIGITGSTLTSEAIQPFIDAAECFMEQIAECTTNLSANCIDMATAYLAAHLLTSSQVGKGSATVKKESLRGNYSVEYLTPSAMGDGIMSTSYGTTANSLVGGCLAQMDKTPTGIYSIGSV